MPPLSGGILASLKQSLSKIQTFFKDAGENVGLLDNSSEISARLKPEIALGFFGGILVGFVIGRGVRAISQSPISIKAVREKKIFRGKGIRVVDGDTFTFGLVDWRGKLCRMDPIKIRIAGIDAPEVRKFGKPEQKLGEEARKHLESLVFEKRVKVQLLAKDQYQRYICQVWVPSWILPFGW
eukprot:CAMPEP_0185265746 /NCGR_PEP_ID=MMETSP1359-20130426/28703_1 /TAXON_ID=552665 /ORGANISM="Bigelowiella longifila, Strain CCMP242" /LENGTH=181 /DNA_ID=CAMNT_0027855213 /DNA_START=201 /DNA_END=743 /DNA_ORIENTATION=+